MIYDCFTFFNELDLLEIRLNILYPHVDKFVICESNFTFSGKSKPLYYEENKKRFSKWREKIIHIVSDIQNKDPNKTVSPFDMAAYQKDSIREALTDCEPDDIIFYGDVDEIWDPKILDRFVDYDLGGSFSILDDRQYKLEQLNYSYYLNNRSSELWQGTNVFKYKNIKNLNDMRADHTNILKEGGWHFTNMGGYEQVLKKLDAYDHQEANIPWVRDNLKYRMEQNQDFLGRANDWKGRPITMWIDGSELPRYVLKNKNKYPHLWKS